MTVHISSACLSGFFSLPVTIEVQTQNGLPRFSLIGLGDSAVKESRERVLAALTSLRIPLPDQILVNLSPAEEKKSGAALDLGIAIGIAAASDVFPPEFLPGLAHTAYIGELSLSGELRPVKGIAAHTARLRADGFQTVICPAENVVEAALIKNIVVVGCESLAEVISYLGGSNIIEADKSIKCSIPKGVPENHKVTSVAGHTRRRPTFDEIVGQVSAKRALMIAASGRHHVLFSGPPGCGKTMLAESFASILPPLNEDEILEAVTIHSIAGTPIENIVHYGERPFRSPHYNISQAGLIGGGSKIRPGEVSLAHHGVLFLDELPEFSRSALESLRVPLESGMITVSRALGTMNLPANFLLVAAMNPCPCGIGRSAVAEKNSRCSCSAISIDRYIKKISQPILDRIDMKVSLQPVKVDQILSAHHTESCDHLRNQIGQHQAYIKEKLGAFSSTLTTAEIFARLPLATEANTLLQKISTSQTVSGRGLNRIVRVAATISLMDRSHTISASAVAEATSYRQSLSS